MEAELDKTEEIVDTTDPNATYITIGQIVHVTDDQGNVQEITYVQDDSLPAIVQVPRQEEDPSYEFYDNARGKININTLESLVKEFNADDPTATDQQKSDRWNQVSQEYNKLTNQTKSRTFLMKKWINSNKPKEKQKSTIKAKAKKINDESSNINTTEQLKKSTLIKQLKEYDTIRLEAAKMQRDACKLEYENAILENEALKKENAILDLQLEAAGLQLALVQAQVSKSQ